MVQIARGTPHGRDRERWGGERGGRDGGGGRGGRRFSPEQRGHYERYERPSGGHGEARRASWLEKYGPPERTDYREEEDGDNNNLFRNAGIFIRIL